jgi:hypothetical protein
VVLGRSQGRSGRGRASGGADLRVGEAEWRLRHAAREITARAQT